MAHVPTDRDTEGVPEAYAKYVQGERLLADEHAHAAAVALERARDLEPEKGSIRETLARAYYRTGRFADAGREFAKSVEIDPVNDYAHFGLGLCLLKAGDHPGARRHLKLATAMRPDASDYHDALARVEPDPAPPAPPVGSDGGSGGATCFDIRPHEDEV